MTTSSTTLRLGIDLDGVVADFNHGWTWRYNRDFAHLIDEPLTAGHVVEWDAPTILTHFDTMDEFWVWAETCAEGRSIFHGLDPYPGAVDALHRLRNAGHHLVILTTKPDFAISDTYHWLGRHDIPATEIHLLDDKTAVSCDIYLDDAAHNLEALVPARPEAVVCRYVQPWTGPIDGTVEVHSWSDFESHVEHHASKR